MNSFRDFCSEKILDACRARHDYIRWGGYGRAFEDPEALIAAIQDPMHQLAAKIQLESGCRGEGVGFARSKFSKSKLDIHNMHGIKQDPYFPDREVGEIRTKEKGGYESSHYVSVDTYAELEAFIAAHGSLCGDYGSYLQSINKAAKETGQYRPKRGPHGIKHAFAQRFFKEAILAGKSTTSAEIETSRRCSHRRGDVFRISYSGLR
ncbi:hypothetical protein [Citrifermentans bremense]|uniref:hypothetical protein n=1 Tax=Citrifermentans bremense TaxID=60035 RepID=UPI00047AB117|nr:hypothetical protein [Citrifermentans bremense]